MAGWRWGARRGVATVCFRVEGVLPRKSNRRRIVRVGERVMVVKSEEALGYVESFAAQVEGMVRELTVEGVLPLHTVVWVDVVVEYPTDARDLDVELLLDLLQRTGIVMNDNQVRCVQAAKAYAAEAACGVDVVVTGVMASYEVRRAAL